MRLDPDTLSAVDRLIHEPARLAILTVLSAAEEVDFNYLLAALGLSRGNLSSHMTRLADARYVTVRKEFVGNVPHTSYALTSKGRSALGEYWKKLDAIRKVPAGPRRPARIPGQTSAQEAGGSG